MFAAEMLDNFKIEGAATSLAYHRNLIDASYFNSRP